MKRHKLPNSATRQSMFDSKMSVLDHGLETRKAQEIDRQALIDQAVRQGKVIHCEHDPEIDKYHRWGKNQGKSYGKGRKFIPKPATGQRAVQSHNGAYRSAYQELDKLFKG